MELPARRGRLFVGLLVARPAVVVGAVFVRRVLASVHALLVVGLPPMLPVVPGEEVVVVHALPALLVVGRPRLLPVVPGEEVVVVQSLPALLVVGLPPVLPVASRAGRRVALAERTRAGQVV